MDDRQKQEIMRVVRLVRRRQRLSVALIGFSLACLVFATIGVLLAIMDRWGAEAWLPWNWIIISFSGLAVGFGLFSWYRTRPETMSTARLIDTELGLKDRLSTALACHDRNDPFALAVVEDATSVAGAPQTREQARRRFRIAPPPMWWASPALVLLALIITFFGQWDLLSSNEVEEVDLEVVRQNASDTVEATIEAIKEDPALAEAMSDVLDELQSQTEASLETKQDEESIRREALKRVSQLDRKLEEMLNGPESQAMKQLEESLKELNESKDSTIKDLVESLSKSDFAEAQKALSSLQDKLESGSLTDEQLDQAAEALQQLASELEALSQNQQDLQDALKQAGLDPNLANDPEALKQAIENAEGLNESQKQQLQEMAESNEQARKMLEELAKATESACKQCQSCKGGNTPKPGESGQSMSNQLSQLEQLQEMIKQAKASRSACQSQCNKLGQGLASAKPSMNQGGTGGYGGVGDSAGAQETATSTTMSDDSQTPGEGPITARMPVDRDLVVGESSLTLERAQEVAREGFDEAMNDTPLPRQYHDALKHYFGDKDAVEKAVEADAASESSKPAAKSGSGASVEPAGKDAPEGE